MRSGGKSDCLSFEQFQQLTENPVVLHRDMSVVIAPDNETKRIAPMISSAVVFSCASTTCSNGPLIQTRAHVRAAVAIDHPDLHPDLHSGNFEKQPEILLAQREWSSINLDEQPSGNEVAAAAGATLAQVIRVLAPSRRDCLSYS